MPGYDGTGPEGNGPYGRGMGPCGRGYPRTNRRFFGFGRGRRGAGRGFWPWQWRGFGSVADEKSQLDSEKNWLSQQLEAINSRLKEIEDKD